MQALAQCETVLNDLGAVKIGAHDTAVAAQVYYEFSFLSESKYWLDCRVTYPNYSGLVDRQWPQTVQEGLELLQVPELQKYMALTFLLKEFR